jgi:hypothetical protein
MARHFCGTTLFMTRQSVTPKKKRGPPPTGKGVPITTRLQPSDLAALDGWIDSQEDEVSRPEALRRLMTLALGAGKRRRNNGE